MARPLNLHKVIDMKLIDMFARGVVGASQFFRIQESTTNKLLVALLSLAVVA